MTNPNPPPPLAPAKWRSRSACSAHLGFLSLFIGIDVGDYYAGSSSGPHLGRRLRGSKRSR